VGRAFPPANARGVEFTRLQNMDQLGSQFLRVRWADRSNISNLALQALNISLFMRRFLLAEGDMSVGFGYLNCCNPA
jgi:hypothetical protein